MAKSWLALSAQDADADLHQTHRAKRQERHKTITIHCESSDSIYRIKEKILDKEGVPPWLVRLVFGGKELRNGRCLDDYWIQNESAMHMIVLRDRFPRDRMGDREFLLGLLRTEVPAPVDAQLALCLCCQTRHHVSLPRLGSNLVRRIVALCGDRAAKRWSCRRPIGTSLGPSVKNDQVVLHWASGAERLMRLRSTVSCYVHASGHDASAHGPETCRTERI